MKGSGATPDLPRGSSGAAAEDPDPELPPPPVLSQVPRAMGSSVLQEFQGSSVFLQCYPGAVSVGRDSLSCREAQSRCCSCLGTLGGWISQTWASLPCQSHQTPLGAGGKSGNNLHLKSSTMRKSNENHPELLACEYFAFLLSHQEPCLCEHWAEERAGLSPASQRREK